MTIYCDSSTKAACLVVKESRVGIMTPYPKPVTNNVGEYKAVILALEYAKDPMNLGLEGVEILTDSQLVVNQVKSREEGGWKCRSPHLLPYIKQVRNLMLETNAKLSWVPREENLAGKVLG